MILRGNAAIVCCFFISLSVNWLKFKNVCGALQCVQSSLDDRFVLRASLIS